MEDQNNEQNKQNEQQNEQPNMIKKLTTKFHMPKIVRIVAGIVVAASIAGGIAYGINEINKSAGEGSGLGGFLDNLTGNNNENEEENESQCSEMLANVLNDDYYDQLIAKAMNDTEFYKSALFDPHPYAFLEAEGHDVEKIKKGEADCYTTSYVLDEEPNNLYMQTRVLVNDSYYHTYLLKYTLTDQEMYDYLMMHGNYSSGVYYTKHVFLNNKISEMYAPEIVGTSKFYKKNMETMIRTYPEQFICTRPTDLKGDGLAFVIYGINPEEQTFSMTLSPNLGSENKIIFDTKVVEGLYKTGTYLLYDGDICRVTPQSAYLIPINEERKSAIIIQSQDVDLIVANKDDPLENYQ